jgi:hypothetical protein
MQQCNFEFGMMQWFRNENEFELDLGWKMVWIWWWNEVSWITSNKIKINEKSN